MLTRGDLHDRQRADPQVIAMPAPARPAGRKAECGSLSGNAGHLRPLRPPADQPKVRPVELPRCSPKVARQVAASLNRLLGFGLADNALNWSGDLA